MPVNLSPDNVPDAEHEQLKLLVVALWIAQSFKVAR